MKTIVLALMLSAASDEHSLGIGIDVLPEAFSVAAARVRFAAALRLPKCTRGGCTWDLGDGDATPDATPDAMAAGSMRCGAVVDSLDDGHVP